MKYIYHHLGLGDHIICNGLVRYYREIYSIITVFCKPHNFANVDYMYRDDENIIILPIGEDSDVLNYIKINKIEQDVIKIGFENMGAGSTFDEAFYSGQHIPFDYRFSKFHFLRNYEKENEVFNNVNPENEDYIFIHGNIDRNKIRKDLKIIDNPIEFGIFDIIKIIENATEVHLMESSIRCLVNSLKIDKPAFYYHTYVRGYSSYLNSKGINKFIKIW